ncbi:Uncharacterized protein MA16_Dca025368 [Dendrobium catenatum]|uniref:PWWP domain-containing protein n=1 Tax=Dendrobium catenatum TaxID=906689 RepID=A0A2I0V9N7_9ASPA|nr:Uncharacterized protein MA16_Dca025368 [Dendrobium catenatum]
MEASDGGGIGLDCSVGNIVWVRRRNGSWWPGRILGLDELSESHLMSPRSGTPVKLLGREDASVDWYNLEKSKRVKAFRCGEFDACIERAESSQSIPIKKREKYARREDAILHALELEKKQKLGTSLNGISNKAIGTYKREPITFSSPEIHVKHDEPVARGKISSYKCGSFLKKVVFSHEGGDIDDPSYLHEGRGNQHFSVEHDNAEAIPRMRGLQDFGLRTAQSKRKPSLSSSWENSCKSIDNHVDSLPSSGYSMEGADQASTSRNDVSVKRKRSYGTVIDEFLVRKRDRRRPLVQVLQSSAELPPLSFQPCCSATGTSKTEEMDKMASTWRAKRSRCVYLPSDLDDHPEHGGYTSEHMLASTDQFEMCNDINYSGNMGEVCTSSCLIEVNDSDCCEGDLLEPDMVEETDMLIDTTDILLPGSKDCDPPEFQVSGGFRSMIQEDVPLSGFISQLHEQAKTASPEAGVSKWRMKGKRNIRNVGKRLLDSGDVKPCCLDLEKCNGSINSTYESKGTLKFGRTETASQIIPGRGFYPIKEELEYAYDENDLIDKDLDQNQLTEYSNMRISVQSGSLNDSDEDSHGLNPSVWEPSDLTCNPFWEEPAELFDRVYAPHTGMEMEPLLVDVDLKVQTSYQGEHVPLVSLMSRLNGKAIIGHPIQIEILEDGSLSHLVSVHEAVMDESTAPQAMWRTARRTAMQRVPRSIPLMAALEEDEADLFQSPGRESKPPLHKEAYYHYLKHQVRPCKKRVSLVHQSGLRKFQKKNAKRISLSSKKTRTLSSLATDGHKLDISNDLLRGLIKPEESVPLVTCVPVKVAFSRILEAVGRPLSAVAHRKNLHLLSHGGCAFSESRLTDSVDTPLLIEKIVEAWFS